MNQIYYSKFLEPLQSEQRLKSLTRNCAPRRHDEHQVGTGLHPYQAQQPHSPGFSHQQHCEDILEHRGNAVPGTQLALRHLVMTIPGETTARLKNSEASNCSQSHSIKLVFKYQALQLQTL